MDTDSAITTAQSAGVFDVLAFVEETAYPEQDVVLFQDVKSAAEYKRLVEERYKLESDESEAESVEKLTTRIDELGKKISDSAMVFHLRGMPPKLVQASWQATAPEGVDVEEWELERDNKLIANTIQTVSNAKGDIDNRLWGSDDVAKLRGFLKEGEFGKLVKAVTEVNFNAMIFDQATDAGFSGRSTYLAE